MKKKDLLITSFILFTGFLFRIYLLTNQSLWYDEGCTIYYSGGVNLTETITRIITIDRYQGILYHILLFFWRQFLGSSEFTLRFFSVLCSTITIIILFFTVLNLYGKNKAIISIFILSFSSYAVYYSQEVRPYSFLILLNTILLYLFSQSLKETKETRYIDFQIISFSIICLLNITASLFNILFILALSLSHLLIYRNIKTWLKWWIPSGILSLPVMIFYITSSFVSHNVSRLHQSILQNISFVFYGIIVGTTYGPPMEKLRGTDKIQAILHYWPHLLLLFSIILIIIISLINTLKDNFKKQNQKLDYFFICLFLLSTLLIIFFTVVTKLNLQPRHFYFSLIPVSIILSSLFTDSRPLLIKGRLFYYTQVSILLLIGLNLFSIYHYYFDKDYYRDDYRSVGEYVNKNKDTPAVLLWGNMEVFRYYQCNSIIDGHNLDKKDMADQISKLSKKSSSVILVINREFYWGKPEELIKHMNTCYKLKKKDTYPYFNIYTFQRNIKNQGNRYVF
ncbi:MAG TPA: glycosyltransferase family 39 protein [Candidatus Eremiobacteraeota bacterium]|nr:MAG: hypothetical protein BWY64_01965 [bacterium ADurb.Bin363]HPZ07372.1 glycosyltransferase family 39 protein [Candidatus Eremiobacteraeota bacterium]